MNNEVSLGQSIVSLSRQIDREIRNRVGEYGLTSIQARVIRFVYHQSLTKEVFQKDIEEKFDIRRSSVTSVLSLMESNGYISRISVEEDGRLKKIVLEEKGQELYGAVCESIMEVEKLLTEQLSKEEYDSLACLTGKLLKKKEECYDKEIS